VGVERLGDPQDTKNNEKNAKKKQNNSLMSNFFANIRFFFHIFAENCD